MGVVGTGAPWSHPGGGGGLRGLKKNVADTRLMSADPSPFVAPHTLWGRAALDLTYDPVHSNAGPVVRPQKRLYDLRAVERIDTFGDWTMRYFPPAGTCKLDFSLLSPYMFVSLCQ